MKEGCKIRIRIRKTVKERKRKTIETILGSEMFSDISIELSK